MRALAAHVLLGFAILGGAPDSAAPVRAAEVAPAPFVPFEEAVDPATLTTDQVGAPVVIAGTLVEVVASRASNVPHRLVLKAEEPAVMVVFWPDVEADLLRGAALPEAGKRVTARGKLTTYRDVLQLRISDPADLRIEGIADAVAAPAKPKGAPASVAGLAMTIAPDAEGYLPVPNANAMRPWMGQELSIKATLNAVRPAWSESAPHVLFVGDSDPRLEVVYWEKDAAPRFTATGTTIYATGELSAYNNRLQLKVGNVENLSDKPLPKERIAVAVDPAKRAEKPAPGVGGDLKGAWPGTKPTAADLQVGKKDVPPGTAVALKDLGPEYAGNVISVEGRVRVVTELDGKRALYITDGVSSVAVVLAGDDTRLFALETEVTVKGRARFDAQRACTVLDAVDASDVVTK